MPDFYSPFSYHFLKENTQTEIAYLDEGPENAPVILFLHGLGDNAHVWAPTISTLRKNFRCIALDLPGHGQTFAHNFSFRMYDFASVISEFLKQLQISNFILVGHSMGGQISVILSLRFPALIEKLILVAPAGFEQFTESEKKLLLIGANYGSHWQTNQNATEIARKTALQKSMEGMLSEPVFNFLPQLQMPVLVIFGEQDAFIPNRYFHRVSTATIAQNGAAQIPNAELQIFPRCGHYPQTEQPGKFLAALQLFLKRK